jgi:hypothetical protein
VRNLYDATSSAKRRKVAAAAGPKTASTRRLAESHNTKAFRRSLVFARARQDSAFGPRIFVILRRARRVLADAARVLVREIRSKALQPNPATPARDHPHLDFCQQGRPRGLEFNRPQRLVKEIGELTRGQRSAVFVQAMPAPERRRKFKRCRSASIFRAPTTYSNAAIASTTAARIPSRADKVTG